MAATRLPRRPLPSFHSSRQNHFSFALRRPQNPPPFRPCRDFSSSASRYEQQTHRKESFASRWRNTKVEWYWVPAGLGIGFLGVRHFSRVREREQAKIDAEQAADEDENATGKPKKRKRIRPSGPWQVQIMSTLPLKAVSRIWGRFNELTIPYYLRVPGFKLYGWIFGVNFGEVDEPDLHTYPNLAAFFFRKLKPGVRPLDPNPNALLSPADGKVIQFGVIEHGEVEQVKGVTYSLDALLGRSDPPSKGLTSGSSSKATSNIASSASSPQPSPGRTQNGQEDALHPDEEFARVNGISYSLPDLLSGSSSDGTGNTPSSQTPPTDQSTTPTAGSESAVRADLAKSPQHPPSEDGKPHHTPFPWHTHSHDKSPTTLYYIVVYLAPGDYHRFHSPVSWVVTARRHFAGELYSVSPYLQRTLPGLFTLNERVVLLGRWRHGFFSYTPVGATNVGSIVINFDRELRTNSLTTDTAADRAAEKAAERGEQYSGFAEATYAGSSKVLGGHALRRGEEMGGFQLGSTIVMVFEAPKGRRGSSLDEGFRSVRRGGWEWCVERGQKVRVGEALGRVLDEGEVREAA